MICISPLIIGWFLGRWIDWNQLIMMEVPTGNLQFEEAILEVKSFSDSFFSSDLMTCHFIQKYS
jgi:hypothetical protein